MIPEGVGVHGGDSGIEVEIKVRFADCAGTVTI